jgi:pimeloyl-ACP methyl ester carboxylesterase
MTLNPTPNFHKNFRFDGSGGLPLCADLAFPQSDAACPLVIYCHGFCGFKDWGNFDIIAALFAQRGIGMLKFNFSHNGTSPDYPCDFVNEEAFGNNNYSKQLEDIGIVVDRVMTEDRLIAGPAFSGNIHLIGHSLGGGLAILYATNDKRIRSVTSWAGIHQCKTPWGNWSPEKMQEWKEKGVAYYVNNRTGQQLPLYYQLYEDYEAHSAELDIGRAIRSLEIPVLLCHGSRDAAVPVEAAYHLKQMQPEAELFVLESDHVFGRSHPNRENRIPDAMMKVVEKTIAFIHRQESGADG